GPRGGRKGARADRDQPRHSLRVGGAETRASQRRHPDHDRGRHHDRVADRDRHRRRDGVLAERAGLVPGHLGQQQGFRGRAGHLARAGDNVRRGQHHRRHPLRGARSPSEAGGEGAVSTVAPSTGRLLRFSTRGRLRRSSWITYVCLAVLVGAVMIALIGPAIAPYDPNLVNLSDSYVGPTGGHLLGFDQTGRDLLSRLLVGARTTILGPLAVVTIAI